MQGKGTKGQIDIKGSLILPKTRGGVARHKEVETLLENVHKYFRICKPT